jgi:hypothetical protein
LAFSLAWKTRALLALMAALTSSSRALMRVNSALMWLEIRK